MTNSNKKAGQGRMNISRRDFISGLAGAAAFTIVPPHVLGGASAPSETVHIGCIGVGDQGTRDMKSFLEKEGVRIVAVCDVDSNNRQKARKIVNDKYGNSSCVAYNDFRQMLEKQKDVEAVLVVTPDHSHALISIAAMRAGKHVYCQKPLTHTVHEALKVAEASREYEVATQLGTVNQASEGSRLLCEWIWDGAIGKVREVHNWSNRPIWPQGIDRPKDSPPVPAGLDWNLWLGPAPYRPYNPAYLPLIWRGWLDFGTGALGDMGCYSFDTIFRVLQLEHPTSVEARGSLFAPEMWRQLEVQPETYPRASMIRWEFPERAEMPAVAVNWYDGGLLPFQPEELEGNELNKEGLLFVGDEGKILADFTGDNPRLIPESRMRDYTPPPQTIPRSIGHHAEWLAACKGGRPAGANFEFSGLVTRALLLGNVGLRLRRKLLWNGANMKITGGAGPDEYLHYPYREGWKL